jgi:alpha-1,2-mannosyltransferase
MNIIESVGLGEAVPPDMPAAGITRGSTRRALTPLPRMWVVASASFAVALGLSIYFASTWQDDFRVYLMGAQDFFTPRLYIHSLRGEFFTYPPFAALAFVPLERTLRSGAAQVAFTVVNLAALVVLVDVSMRAVRRHLAASKRWCWALGLAGPFLFLDPVLLTVRHGQVNLILAAAVLWDITRVRPKGSRALPLGVATGIAAAIKLTPLIFVPYLLFTRRWRGAGVCVGTFVICEAIAFALSPSSSWMYWTRSVFDVTRVGGYLGPAGLLAPIDQSLTSVLDRFHHAPIPSDVLWALSMLVGAAGLAIAVLAHRRWSSTLGVLLCATTALVVSPVTWTHHMVWVVPVIIWLAAAPERPRFGRAAAALTALLFWCAPVWWIPSGARALHEGVWQLIAGSSFFTWAVLLLAGAASTMLWRRLGYRIIPRPLESQDRQVLAVVDSTN